MPAIRGLKGISRIPVGDPRNRRNANAISAQMIGPGLYVTPTGQIATDNAALTTALLGAGLSVTIVTAQLTPTGAQGSMTFTNGLLTAQTPAT